LLEPVAETEREIEAASLSRPVRRSAHAA
jgi:hypothetical protein